jgi:spore maturation protein CgeB
VTIDYHGMNGRPELSSAQYYKTISQARMGLNISVVRTWGHTPRATPEELYLYASDRISHYMGSGLLILTTRDNQLEDLFKDNKELVFFQTPEELLEKVLYFKEHDDERQAIAYAGWRKAHAYFSEQCVAHYIVEATFRRDAPDDYAWPTQKY